MNGNTSQTDSTQTQVNTDAGAGGEGSQQVSWFDSLPDDVKTNEAYAGLKDKALPDVLKDYADTQGRLKGALTKPADDATPEEKAEYEKNFRAFLGVPEKPEGYNLTMPEGIPQDDPIVSAFVAAAHENALNTPQAQNILGKVVHSIIEHQEAVKLVNKESMQKEWGDQFDTNVNLAISALEKAGTDAGLKAEDVQTLAKQLPSFPSMLKVMAVVGKAYQQDTIGGGSSKGGSGQMARTAGGVPQLDFPSMDKK